MQNQEGSLIVTDTLNDHFLKTVWDAANKLQEPISGLARNYIADLLIRFMATDKMFKDDGEGHLYREPLANMFGRALQAKGPERIAALRELGDTALFITGFFPDLFKRKPVDVDYCVDMGRAAYESLSALLDEDSVYGPGEGLYFELAEKFVACADVIAEIGDAYRPGAAADLARAKQIWEKTGSKRLENILRQHNKIPGLDGGP